MMRRQCTGKWKIAPINRWLRGELERRQVVSAGMTPYPGAIELWIGITTDELTRAKTSQERYKRHRYPLLSMREVAGRRLVVDEAGRTLSRTGVMLWLAEHGLPVPPKSGCYMCPFHDKSTWLDILTGPDAGRALAFDLDVRDMRAEAGYVSYLSSQRVPLADIDTAHDGQLSLFEMECEGLCGI
jgi:hypothetical protein